MRRVSELVRLAARFRVPLGFICGIAVFWLAAPTRTSIIAGLPFVILGEMTRIWAAGHLNKSREVTRSGPYRYVGHPLYLGSSLIGAGLAIGAVTTVVVLIVFVYLLTTLTSAIRSEQAFLSRKFGETYDEYRAVRVADDTRRFTWSRAMANREYRAVIGVALALLLLISKATYNGTF
jgi:protein-S-isoprenylcysteine O-methyltransferase Ste14